MTPPWHPERLAARLLFLRRRARLRAEVAAFLTARGYTEVETPVLQPCPGMEPNLDPFATRYAAKLGADARALFLQFSPEFAMKKLLAGGAGPIFQFARVFRNGEAGPNHQPEFTMLEWYRPGLDLAGLMDETEALIRAVCPDGLRRGDAVVPTDVIAVRVRDEVTRLPLAGVEGEDAPRHPELTFEELDQFDRAPGHARAILIARVRQKGDRLLFH